MHTTTQFKKLLDLLRRERLRREQEIEHYDWYKWARASLTIPGNYAIFYKLLAQVIYENSLPPVLPEEAYHIMQLIETSRSQQS